jgi:hypothetical protein
MPQALQFLVFTFAGWLNRRQEDLVDYLREENRVLREQIGGRPLQLTDAQRRRLAVRDKALGRRALTQVAGIVTPDTILRGLSPGLEMGDVRRDAGLVADLYRLLDGFQELIFLVPHVSVIDASEGDDFSNHRDNLVGVGIASRDVCEVRGQTVSPAFHGFTNEVQGFRSSSVP